MEQHAYAVSCGQSGRRCEPVGERPLAELAASERYLALEVAGRRHNLGLKYGMLRAQLALALEGADREEVLAQLVEVLAQRQK